MLRYNFYLKYTNRYFSKFMEKTQPILSREDCINKLKEWEIDFKLYEHEKVMNVAEMREHIKLEKAPMCKNLFYGHTKKPEFYLICANIDTEISRKGAFWKEMNLTHNLVRAGKPEKLKDVLGIEGGAVNPFDIVNDLNGELKAIILDQTLTEGEYISFHPHDNTATVELKTQDFLSYLEKAGKTVKIFDLTPDVQAEEKKPAPEKGGKKGKPEKKEKPADGECLLKLDAKKAENFSEWYHQVIFKADLVDNYDVQGCYIIRPNAYFIWEQIQAHFNKSIKKLGVSNCYFPIFVQKKNLEKEQSHIEGFSAEVAWVTHGGKSKLAEPLALRPTSETILNPHVAKKVQGWRDLPIKLNQWSNVVRWEFKHPTPFIRTREFLWQEGHTTHSTSDEAEKMVFDILDAYEKVYNEILCIPVTKGKKSEKEKFAGADYTTCIESFVVENGRSIQAATSHYLGQNFSKMFNIEFENKSNKKEFAFQSSWGVSTRSIGAYVMTHGDDKGIVMTPACAEYQIVIVPIYMKDVNKNEMNAKAHELADLMIDADLRVWVDDRDNYTPGFRYNYSEIRGTPLRLELGPKDLEKQQFMACSRFDGKKSAMKWETLVTDVKVEFKRVSEAMLNRAKERQANATCTVKTWPDFMTNLNQKKQCFAPWCNVEKCEEDVKDKSAAESQNLAQEEEVSLTGSAKTLCIPLEQPNLEENTPCFACGQPAKLWALWGRSY